MAEETVWRGSSSQWKNMGLYLLSLLAAIVIVLIFAAVWHSTSGQMKDFSPYILCLLAVPIFMVSARYLQTKNKIYELTTERLKISEGVFSKVTDTLELYRVKDLETRQPFLYRLGGVEIVQINTSDHSTPFVLIEAIPSQIGFGDKLRNQVEAVRMQKRVREIDIE